MQTTDAYLALAEHLTRAGIVSDPWVDGAPRFCTQPVVLSPAEHRALQRATEAIGAVYDEFAQICARDPELTRRYFALTPYQQRMWDAGVGKWHGIARADVFMTQSGPTICELNCDTPSGEAEAVLLNEFLQGALENPNRDLESRWCDHIARVGATITRAPLTVGIIYPTELVEDLSMVLLYQRWFAQRGFRVVLGSPYNLRRLGDRVGLFDTPCDVFVRHYKTDWWSEREPVWRDAPPFADAEPLAPQLELLLQGVAAKRCAVVNPFGAVLTQNKRAMAFMWEERARFSPSGRDAIARYLPHTVRLETLTPDELAAKDAWVLKSDYGCESAEVVIGADCTLDAWQRTLAQAIPTRFVAQRRFVPLSDADGLVVNYGVYLIDGAAAGYFSRVHVGATAYDSLTAPTFVAKE